MEESGQLNAAGELSIFALAIELKPHRTHRTLFEQLLGRNSLRLAVFAICWRILLRFAYNPKRLSRFRWRILRKERFLEQATSTERHDQVLVCLASTGLITSVLRSVLACELIKNSG